MGVPEHPDPVELALAQIFKILKKIFSVGQKIRILKNKALFSQNRNLLLGVGATFTQQCPKLPISGQWALYIVHVPRISLDSYGIKSIHIDDFKSKKDAFAL